MKNKLRTRRSAIKRFKKTSTGKFLYKKAFCGHLLEKKSKKRKHSLKLKGSVSRTEIKSISLMLPN